MDRVKHGFQACFIYRLPPAESPTIARVRDSFGGRQIFRPPCAIDVQEACAQGAASTAREIGCRLGVESSVHPSNADRVLPDRMRGQSRS